MSTVAVQQVPVRPRRRRRYKSPLFTLLGLLLLVLAVAGFWPQYFTMIAGGVPDPTTRFWLIHLHTAVFLAWMLAYLVQSTLVWTGRTATHLKLGPILASFGFAVGLVGLLAAFPLAARFGARMGDMEQGAAFVFFPVIDMVYFGGFLAVAVVLRKKPEIHKRALFVATFSIAVVGWGRLIGRMPYESPWFWQPLTLAPLLLVMAYDLAARRTVYTVMVAGLLVHLARLNAEGFAESEYWLPLGRALIAPFA